MINISSNAAAFLRDMNRRQNGDLKIAMAAALTRTGQDAKAAIAAQIVRVFDRPTSYTRRAVYLQPAKKSRLVARVGIMARQAEYLGLQETGGTRRPRRRALLIPVQIRKNKFGNMSRGAVARLLARPDVFSGTVGGVAGIWQRRRGALKLLVAYAASAQYAPRFGFEGVAADTVRARFGAQFDRALSEFVR